MLDEEADETVLGLQVENVELVDPGRNEQQRYRIGLRGERRVLDQLDEAVSVDDLPLRDVEVLSWRESFGVGHSHPTLAQTATRLRRPSATLPPPVSIALRRAAGFVGKNKVGLVASINCWTWNMRRCRSVGSATSRSASSRSWAAIAR